MLTGCLKMVVSYIIFGICQAQLLSIEIEGYL